MEGKSPKAEWTKSDLRRLRKASKPDRYSWTPPPTLNNDSLNDLNNEPRLWLYRAVDLMAFGGKRVPKSMLEASLRRFQASRALCDAARIHPIKFMGNPDQSGDKSDPIPQSYFDSPRCLGHDDNTLEERRLRSSSHPSKVVQRAP
jgi:hypothetical protein